jgi:hypothetical protein
VQRVVLERLVGPVMIRLVDVAESRAHGSTPTR